MTGTELRAIRLSWNLSQSAFGRVFGYGIKSIANMERSRTPIPNTLILHINAEIKLRKVKKVLDST